MIAILAESRALANAWASAWDSLLSPLTLFGQSRVQPIDGGRDARGPVRADLAIPIEFNFIDTCGQSTLTYARLQSRPASQIS
jgi:hypothetical protein